MQLSSVLARQAKVPCDRVLADAHQPRRGEGSASFPDMVQHRQRLIQGQFGTRQRRARPFRETPAARTTPDHADGLLVPAPSLEFQIAPAANPAIRTRDILAAKVFDRSHKSCSWPANPWFHRPLTSALSIDQPGPKTPVIWGYYQKVQKTIHAFRRIIPPETCQISGKRAVMSRDMNIENGIFRAEDGLPEMSLREESM